MTCLTLAQVRVTEALSVGHVTLSTLKFVWE